VRGKPTVKLAQSLVNVGVFLPEDTYLVDVLKFGRFKPIKFNWKNWIDQYSVTITLSEEKKIKISKSNEIQLAHDLFARSSLSLNSIHQKILLFFAGRRIVFYSLDSNEILRCWESEQLLDFQPVSILTNGLTPLKLLLTDSADAGNLVCDFWCRGSDVHVCLEETVAHNPELGNFLKTKLLGDI
jgi:hypothetical protein